MEHHQFFLIILVLLLGLRHGLDADHLATINAITQNISDKNKISKLVGVFFALGHGSIVIIVSILLSIGVQQSVPTWLKNFGDCISAFFLIAFGIWNLFGLIKEKKHIHQINAINPKTLLFKPLTSSINHPILIGSIGALFALSFDTVSQTAAFSLLATTTTSWFFAGFLGTVFTIGMMVSDGINGLIVAKLLNRADTFSTISAYLIKLTIIFSSLIIGGLNAVKLVH